MKPLIIAVDIVKFSLNHRAELKMAMENFFNEIYSLREGTLVPHVLPTGDGAILVWHWGDDNQPHKREEVLIPQKIIAKVLGALKLWSQSTNSQVRLGIHCDHFIEHIQIANQSSIFGHGISECVRHETAADPNQALLSQAAQEHLQVPAPTSGLVLDRAFFFFDKHGKKHVAFPIGLQGDKHWSLRTPASAQESAVRAELRKKEMPANNAFLQTANSAKIVAMTYKTLGATLADRRKSIRLRQLEKAEVCVFSLPALQQTHPTLSNNFHALEEEWGTGVRQTITGLLNKGQCPKLTDLDLTLISAAPALTATVTVGKNERGDRESLLRYHPILDGCEPEDIPTLILNKTGEDISPLFDAFEFMIENVGKNPPRMKFPLKRGIYIRDDIPGFVNRLRTVCNHSGFGPQDRQFTLQLVSSDSQAIPSISITPEKAFGLLDGHRKTNQLHVVWNAPENVLLLSQGQAKGGTVQTVDENHLFACFVLMTWNRCVVLVMVKRGRKPGWTHDIPGGKITEIDNSECAAAQRETFEELGMVLNIDKLHSPVGCLYDHRSAKERGVPVVAQYYHYQLQEGEYDYLFKVAKTTTKGETLVLYSLDQLLEEKRRNTGYLEAVCHAPLGSIEHIAHQLGSSSGNG